MYTHIQTIGFYVKTTKNLQWKCLGTLDCKYIFADFIQINVYGKSDHLISLSKRQASMEKTQSDSIHSTNLVANSGIPAYDFEIILTHPFACGYPQRIPLYMRHQQPRSMCFLPSVYFQRKLSLHWRHDGGDCVSNHRPRDCLLNRLFRRRSKKTSKLRVIGLCEGNPPGTVEFPAQMASNAENVSIWWRHHGRGLFFCAKMKRLFF